MTITADRMQGEPVGEITPCTYAEAYRRIEDMLKGDRAPAYYEEIEISLDEMRDLWPGGRTCVQQARLAYDLLRQFDAEGRLKRELRTQKQPDGLRERWYFSLNG